MLGGMLRRPVTTTALLLAVLVSCGPTEPPPPAACATVRCEAGFVCAEDGTCHCGVATGPMCGAGTACVAATATCEPVAVCATGIILGAAYMLYLYRRVIFGVQKNADAAAMPDLDTREWLMMVPLALAVLWMGVYPESFLAPMRQDIIALDARLAQARPVGDARIKVAAAKPAAPAQAEAH